MSSLVRAWRNFGWACIVSGLLLALGWTYAHRDDAKLVSYLINCFPVPLTIVIAFMPDLRKAHIVWRFGIVGFGILWSCLLWRQMDLASQQAIQDQKGIVGDAVNKANNHSDAKFGEMKKNFDSLSSDLDKAITTQLNKTESDLTSSIGKVGKPDPPERPKFTFSLWPPNGLSGDSPLPLESETIPLDPDGSYHVLFVIRNDSGVQAQGVDEWVHICDGCSFATEPAGFDKPKGMDERERHRSMGAINAAVSILEGNEIHIKPPPNPFKFSLIFKVGCANCGPVQGTKQYWIDPMPH